MPEVTFGVHDGGRIRIEVCYEDYKKWEEILGTNATEATTTTEQGHYWKSLYFKIGKTEYRISGPMMPSRTD